MRCILLGSSPIRDVSFIKASILPDDFIICVDGGFRLCQKLNVKPDMFIGDGDSYKGNLNSINSTIYSKEKDQTDMMLAIKHAIKKGCDDFLIFGGTNARLDHAYANLCCLEFLSKKNVKARISDQNNDIFILKKQFFKFKKNDKKYISFFPFGCSSCTLTATGLKYPLSKTVLSSSFPLGVSNEIVKKEAEVNVQKGKAIVFLSNDSKDRFKN